MSTAQVDVASMSPVQRTISIKLDKALSPLIAELARGCNLAAGLAAEHRRINRAQFRHPGYYPVGKGYRLGAQQVSRFSLRLRLLSGFILLSLDIGSPLSARGQLIRSSRWLLRACWA